MMSAMLLKMRLVTKSGLSLAEYPQEEDFVKSQLAGGIMSALIGFSREVHDRDLHSVNMQDRKIFFIPAADEFFIIVETSLDIEEDMLAGVLDEIREKSSWLLSTYSSDKLEPKQANVIISELGLLFQRFELLHDMDDMVDDIELSQGQIVEYRIDPQMDFVGGDTIEKDLYNFCSQLKYGEIDNKPYHVFILYLPSVEQAGIFVLTTDDGVYDIGGIVVHDPDFNTLTCVISGYRDQIGSMVEMLPHMDKRSLLETLENSVSVHTFEVPADWRDYLSFAALDRLVHNAKLVVSSVIIGRPIVVVGDSILVKIVVATLSIFAQHKPTVISMMEDEIPPDRFHLIGMEEIDEIPEDTLLVDVMTGKTKPTGSGYEYFKRVKQQYTLPGAIEDIRLELETIVNAAVKSTNPDSSMYAVSEFQDVIIGIRDELNPLIGMGSWT